MDGFKETEWGIEDEAGTSIDFQAPRKTYKLTTQIGELRGDWRPHYLVLLTTSIGHPPILDLYLSHPQHAAEETLRQLKLELTTSVDSDLQNVAKNLSQVTMDSGRDAEEKAERERQRAEWERRSGQEEGIWRAEDEDEDEDESKDESKGGMCIVM